MLKRHMESGKKHHANLKKPGMNSVHNALWRKHFKSVSKNHDPIQIIKIVCYNVNQFFVWFRDVWQHYDVLTIGTREDQIYDIMMYLYPVRRPSLRPRCRLESSRCTHPHSMSVCLYPRCPRRSGCRTPRFGWSHPIPIGTCGCEVRRAR